MICKLIGKSANYVWWATKIKGTSYERYFEEIPEPTFIEGRVKYYDSSAIEKFRKFFEMDKMQNRIFIDFMQTKREERKY